MLEAEPVEAEKQCGVNRLNHQIKAQPLKKQNPFCKHIRRDLLFKHYDLGQFGLLQPTN